MNIAPQRNPNDCVMSKRKCYQSDGSDILAARMRRDVSLVFDLPCISIEAAMAEQPVGFAGTLLNYQRRSLHRMLEIEGGVELAIKIGSLTHTFHPRFFSSPPFYSYA